MSISVLLLFRHYISHNITFGAPSSGRVLCSACGAFISCEKISLNKKYSSYSEYTNSTKQKIHVSCQYSKTCLKQPLKKRLNEGRKDCRMLHCNTFDLH